MSTQRLTIMPEGRNYTATVVAVSTTVPLAGCDNVVGVPVFGYQAIVGRDTQPGEMMIFFPAESQLSEEYCRHNNLFRDSTKNENPDKKGYIEENRRVRAQKFRGHVSNGLLMPLSSIAYAADSEEYWMEFNVGDEFHSVYDQEICRKYVVPVRVGFGGGQMQPKEDSAAAIVDKRLIPEHIDTTNYHKYASLIYPNTEIVVTQKLHGTSIRVAHIPVKRTLSLLEKVARHFGVNVVETEYDYVYASRKVIKSCENAALSNDAKHWYESDIWSSAGREVSLFIPKNYIIYGELIGYTSHSSSAAAIQKGYTYDVRSGSGNRLYIYRVSVVNPDGNIADLSWDALIQFCSMNGLQHVPELWRGNHDNFKVQDWMDKCYRKEGYQEALPLSDEGTVDEGVCIRVEGIVPDLYKAKSPLFFEYETKMLDSGEADTEATESTETTV